MGRGVATIAAASVVAAVAFAGYATGSVGVVTGAVDNVLVRSEKPKPKPWERVDRQQKPATGSPAGFRKRVSGSGKESSRPAYNSDFEQVLEQRAAVAAAKEAELRARLGKPDQPAAEPSDDAFRARVAAESEHNPAQPPATKDFGSRVGAKPKKSNQRKKRPFEKRVEGSGQ